MKKRIFSFAMAAVMTLSMGTVAFATDYETFTGDDMTGNPLSYTQTIDGTGETRYVDTEIYSVVLPTEEALDFYLDPQGLLALQGGGAIDLDELEGGKIVGKVDYVPMINNSAVPINLNVKARAIKTGTGTVSILDDYPADYDDPEIYTSTGLDMVLYLAFSSENVQTTSDDFTSEVGFALGTVGDIELDFAMPAATYSVSERTTADPATAPAGTTYSDDGTYKIVLTPDSGNGTFLQVGGWLNPKADWSAYIDSSTVGLKAVFEFEKDTLTHDPDDDYFVGDEGELVQWLLAETYDEVALQEASTTSSGPKFTSAPYTLSRAATALQINYSVGNKLGSATSVTKVSVVHATDTASQGDLAISGTSAAVTASTITAEGTGTLTFIKAKGLYLTGWTLGEYTLTVTFNDGSTAICKVTVTA